MSAAQTELILQGRHRDPFSYLGPHKGQIRAWLPQAINAAVLTGGQAVHLRQVQAGTVALVVATWILRKAA